MKTLFPAQAESRDKILSALRTYRGALDTSMTGTGKTVVAADVAKHFPNVAVICPKIVIPHWYEELGEVGINPLFVINYEKLRRASIEFLTKRGKKIFQWHVPKDTLLIWDECHKAKGPFTQNAMMLVAARNANLMNLMISATACEDPTEMRSIGYALGLHNLLQSEDGLKSWVGWMKDHGCWKDQWHKWNRGGMVHLKRINKAIYGSEIPKGTKVTIADMPTAFAENTVIIDRLQFSNSRDIEKAYTELDIDPEVLERLLATEDMLDDIEAAEKRNAEKAKEAKRKGIKLESKDLEDISILTKMLRARQVTEALKLPDLLEMTQDALTEGYSPIVFVNFRDTAEALFNALDDPGIVIGGQADDDRDFHVKRFQRNENRVIIVMTSAGGTGVNLHDTHGGFPRLALFSPTFNFKEHYQALGRAHRAGGKSPVLQKILVAANTIEEKVIDLLEERRKAHDTLHQKPETTP